MDIYLALLAAVAGYLTGSISFARVVIRLFAPGQKVKEIRVQVPGSTASYHSKAVSATAVNVQLGPKYGCLTSILDMLKVAGPALALRVWHPQPPYYLAFAAASTLGHNWPLYYHFRGGRGMSTIIGGMLVVDWIGIVSTTAVSIGLGTWLHSYYYANKLSILLMIPWLWFRHRDWRLVAYAVLVNLMNLIAILPEAQEILRLQRQGNLAAFLKAERVRLAESGSGQPRERLTFYGMWARLLARLGRRSHEANPPEGDL